MHSSGNGGGGVDSGDGGGVDSSGDGGGGVDSGDGSGVDSGGNSVSNVLGDNRGGRVGGVGGVVDMGLLNDLLDRVDLVGLGHMDGPGHLNVVGLGHVLGHDDLPLNGDGDMDGHVNVVLVDLELGHDLGLDRGDLGVGPDRGEDPLLGHGVGGSGS